MLFNSEAALANDQWEVVQRAKVSDEFIRNLTAEYTEDEIKRAVFQLNPTKHIYHKYTASMLESADQRVVYNTSDDPK